jgi:hypothetical protein
MGAPSQMLQENSGKGLGAVPRLPQMITGPQRIEAGADAANLAALRAPKATGYSLGTREGKEAELASLQSSLAQPPGPNSDLLGSGPQYLQSRGYTPAEARNYAGITLIEREFRFNDKI